jgi:hypothetical protein
MLQGYCLEEWQKECINSYQVPIDEDTKARTLHTAAMVPWQKRMIQTTWTQMIGLWKLRNNKRHRRNTWEILTNKIQHLYNNREQYPPRVLRDWIDAYRVNF